MRDLPKHLRGGDFRHAVKAVAALRDLDAVAGRALIPSLDTVDEQRAFQLLIARLVVEGGVRGLAALEVLDQARTWMTPMRRARIAKAMTSALDRCAGNPKLPMWPDKYIELLGLSAGGADQHAIALLEGFRPIAGETRRYETEALDPDNLPWSTQVVAEKKGIPPGTQFKRIWSKPTGLLDLKGLEKAIERIRSRTK